ncbi:MAG: N-(5'-phosphoribosyl)anthranilate isomerase [Bacteroidota bacterium]
MLNTPIKAGQINNLTDARYFAAWGVKWLGFNLDFTSDESWSIARVKEIMDWVEGPIMVGEFGLQKTDEIQAAAEFLKLDYLQLNNFATAEQAEALQHWKLMKEFVIDDLAQLNQLAEQLNSFEPFVEHFLLNFRKNNFTCQQLKAATHADDVNTLLGEFGESHSILLSIDFEREDLSFVSAFAGFEVVGGVEEKVGYKSFDELDELFEVLELND